MYKIQEAHSYLILNVMCSVLTLQTLIYRLIYIQFCYIFEIHLITIIVIYIYEYILQFD